MRRIEWMVPLLLAGFAGAARGQSLADRIMAVPEGTVRLAYGVREGICGDGETFIRDRARGENNVVSFDDGNGRSYGRGWRDRPCEPGPARVAISKSGGTVIRVRVFVGGEWGVATAGVTDLGMVPAPAAAKALVAISARARRADNAVFAAIIADSAVVWPDLLALARDDRATTETRKNAVFWLSQAAGDEATRGLTALAEDDDENREVRDQAVFAISQLPAKDGVPVLIRLVRTNPDPRIRRKALFWLGQSDDPRALQLFEEILTKGS
ncbi:MAG TPA: HEAT repeat domain-containing protein [Gemmatimonadales bacterium]